MFLVQKITQKTPKYWLLMWKKAENHSSWFVVPYWYPLNCITCDILASQNFHTCLKSFISVLWEMPYISPSHHQFYCRSAVLHQPYQGCPLPTPLINGVVLTRKPYSGLNSLHLWKANGAKRSLIPARCRAETFRSRWVAHFISECLLSKNK